MKKHYYVALSGEIHTKLHNNDANYDFEVVADEQEIQELQSLLVQKDDQDFVTYVQAHIPYKTSERMKENITYDFQMQHIYEMIYRLGTERTKRKMRQSGLTEGVKPDWT